jgi:hypothetical protein
VTTTRAPFLILPVLALAGVFLLTPRDTNAHNRAVELQVSTPEQLISAVQNANSSGVPTIIKLAPGNYQFATAFETADGPTALPPMTGKISLVGKNKSTTILDGELTKRLIAVQSAGHVTVKNLTLTRGRVSSPVSSVFTGGGGGAANFGGTLVLENAILSESLSLADEGNAVTSGGGVVSFGGHLILRNADVTGNWVLGAGAGVGIVGGEGIIYRSTITNNRTALGAFSSGVSSGGGVYVGNAEVAIWDSTIAGNRAGIDSLEHWVGNGGGIFNQGKLWLINTAVKENVALPIGLGGGIENAGELIVIDSTIGNNMAEANGGGIYNRGSVKLKGATISGNEAQGIIIVGTPAEPPYPDNDCFFNDLSKCTSGGSGIWNEPGATVVAVRSLIARNINSPGGFFVGQDCHGTIASKGYNALGSTQDCELSPQSPQTPMDFKDLDPLIGELEDNGDPGNAHFPLMAGSPLIDAGGKITKHSCTSHDQLRQRRVDGDGDGKVRCDIGAVEFVP